MKKKQKIAAIAALAVLALAIVGAVGYGVFQKATHPIEYKDEVARWAQHFGVDPYMIYAIISTESSFNPQAESSAGARGLMQMTSDTFDWIKGKIAPQEALGFDDLFQPDVAIRFGVCYFSYCMQRYGQDLSTAAAAYHSGWGTVDGLLQDTAYTDDGARLHTFPYPQMNHYVKKINRSYQNYLRMYAS